MKQNRSRSHSNNSSISITRKNRDLSRSLQRKNGSPEKDKQYKNKSPSVQGRRNYRRSRSRSVRKDKRQQGPAPQNKKLFVTNIDGKFPQSEVREYLKNQFGIFGKISEIVVKTKPNSSNTYAFIQYERIQDSIKAQSQMNTKKFKGKQLKVQFGRNTTRTRNESQRIYCQYCRRSGHLIRDCRQRQRREKQKQRYDDYDLRRRRSYSRDRPTHRHRYSRSRSSSSSYRYRKRSPSRSPPYQGRRYQRHPRYDRYDRYERQERGRYDRYRHERDQRDRERYNREPRESRISNQDRQKWKGRSPRYGQY